MSPVHANNQKNIENFHNFFNNQLVLMQRNYERKVNIDLSLQQWDGLFQRNVTLVIKEAFEECIEKLSSLYFILPSSDTGTNQSLLNLLEKCLKPFDQLIDKFIHYVLQKHRSSCAISNFSAEHSPSKTYFNETLDLIRKDWEVFFLHCQEIISKNACIESSADSV